ncbi:MAG: transporter substrate-binding domain-containing protein, partial [Anaerolineae bacterium]
MKKRYILLGFILLAVAGLLAWHLLRGKEEKEDETWARIEEIGVLRVGLDPSYPPFEDMDEGNRQIFGYDVDLAQEIGRRLDVEVEFVLAGFDGLYDALQMGKFDVIISALPYDPRLTQDVRYTVSYFNAGQVLVVREDEAEISNVDGLAAKRLAVELGSTGDLESRRLERYLDALSLQPLPTPL